jgi:hypothetical protein
VLTNACGSTAPPQVLAGASPVGTITGAPAPPGIGAAPPPPGTLEEPPVAAGCCPGAGAAGVLEQAPSTAERQSSDENETTPLVANRYMMLLAFH